MGINWGYFHVATAANDSSMSYTMNQALTARTSFATSGYYLFPPLLLSLSLFSLSLFMLLTSHQYTPQAGDERANPMRPRLASPRHRLRPRISQLLSRPEGSPFSISSSLPSSLSSYPPLSLFLLLLYRLLKDLFDPFGTYDDIYSMNYFGTMMKSYWHQIFDNVHSLLETVFTSLSPSPPLPVYSSLLSPPRSYLLSSSPLM